MTFYYFLADLVKTYDSQAEDIAEKLSAVAKKIFTRSHMFLATTGEKEEKQAVDRYLGLILNDMPEGEKKEAHLFDFPAKEINEAFLTSGKVQYVAKGGNFRDHGFTYTGALRVMKPSCAMSTSGRKSVSSAVRMALSHSSCAMVRRCSARIVIRI